MGIHPKRSTKTASVINACIKGAKRRLARMKRSGSLPNIYAVSGKVARKAERVIFTESDA